jgi:hypothetical protein
MHTVLYHSAVTEYVPTSHADKIGPYKFCFLKAFSLRIGIMAFPLKKKPLSLFENAHTVGTPSASSSSSGKSPKQH